MKILFLALLSCFMLSTSYANEEETAEDTQEETQPEVSQIAQDLEGYESLTKPIKQKAQFYYLIDLEALAERYMSKIDQTSQDYDSQVYDATLFKKVLKPVKNIARAKDVEVIYIYSGKDRRDVFAEQVKDSRIKIPTFNLEHSQSKSLFKSYRAPSGRDSDFIHIYKNDGTVLMTGTEELLYLWKACTINAEEQEEEEIAEKLDRAKNSAQKNADKTYARIERKRKAEAKAKAARSRNGGGGGACSSPG